MKVLKLLMLFVWITSLFWGKGVIANATLQAQIDATPKGGVLHLKTGVYYEPIILEKEIQIIGEDDVIFKSCHSPYIIHIKGENVTLKGIKVDSCNDDRNTSAINVKGKNHVLEDIEIVSSKIGLRLENVENSIFKNIHITGIHLNNGFDIWESHDNTFEGNQIKNVKDGFYMEYSDKNKFIGNTMSDSRYGLHVMFSNEITFSKNVSTRNFTGAMIMESTNTFVTDNQLTENNLNVNAQGLLLYQVHQSTIANNLIAHNRVGIYMEDSTYNQINSNYIRANFVGTQIKKIKNNRIENNTFASNVNDSQAVGAVNNTILNNYWDAAWKIDIDGDGKSELSYRADPYFINLANDVPAYQLFFQHPGMIFLQKMLKSSDHLLVTDSSPLMKPHSTIYQIDERSTVTTWLISMLMMVSSVLFIYFGRKKR
jgi:nitrous oxidase accessory protein